MMRALIQHIYHRIIFIVDYWVAHLSHRKPNKNSVAVVRVDAIGDFILWLPAAQGLRQALPGARITLIGNVAWAELARGLPYWDEVIAINTKWFAFAKLLYRWKMVSLIASKGFEVAVQPTFSRIISTGDSLVRAINSPERIGISGDMSNLSIDETSCANNWYTKLYPIGDQNIQELEKNRLAMKTMFSVQIQKALPKLDLLDVNQSELVDPLSPYVVIAPGASWEGKRWSIQNYSAMAKFIVNQLQLQVVVCGSKEEFELGAIIQNEVPSIVNLAGKTSLKEMGAVLQSAKLVIGNDSSAIHIANAVQTQSICVLGGGHFGRFLPYPEDFIGLQPILAFKKMDCYQCNWRCTLTEDFTNGAPCISGVTPEEMKLLVENILGNHLDLSRIH